VLEASIQALLELIERDIWSFELVRSSSRLVDPASLPRLRAARLSNVPSKTVCS